MPENIDLTPALQRSELENIEPEVLDVGGLVATGNALIQGAFRVFAESTNTLLRMQQHALLAQVFAFAAASDEEARPALLKAFENKLREVRSKGPESSGFGTGPHALQRLFEYVPTFGDLFRRLLYAANADLFEICVADVLVILNYCFPRVFIDRDALEKVSVPGRILLEGGTILDARLRFVESRVMAQVFSDSLPVTLKKLGSKLQNQFPFDAPAQKELARISAIRNILTHNRGIANATFLTRLKRAGIDPDIELGQTIPITEQTRDMQIQFLWALAEAISTSVTASLRNIAEHEVALRSA